MDEPKFSDTSYVSQIETFARHQNTFKYTDKVKKIRSVTINPNDPRSTRIVVGGAPITVWGVSIFGKRDSGVRGYGDTGFLALSERQDTSYFDVQDLPVVFVTVDTEMFLGQRHRPLDTFVGRSVSINVVGICEDTEKEQYIVLVSRRQHLLDSLEQVRSQYEDGKPFTAIVDRLNNRGAFLDRNDATIYLDNRDFSINGQVRIDDVLSIGSRISVKMVGFKDTPQNGPHIVVEPVKKYDDDIMDRVRKALMVVGAPVSGEVSRNVGTDVYMHLPIGVNVLVGEAPAGLRLGSKVSVNVTDGRLYGNITGADGDDVIDATITSREASPNGSIFLRALEAKRFQILAKNPDNVTLPSNGQVKVKINNVFLRGIYIH